MANEWYEQLQTFSVVDPCRSCIEEGGACFLPHQRDYCGRINRASPEALPYPSFCPTLLIQDALQVSGIFEMWYLRLLGGSLLLSDVLQLFLIANRGRICGCRARDVWRSLPWLCRYWLDLLCLTRDNSTPLFQFSRPLSAIFQFVRQGLWRTH